MVAKVEAVQKRVGKLEPGETLAKAVYSPKGSRLFDEEKELTAEDIAKLEKWEIRYVYVAPENGETKTTEDNNQKKAS